MLTGRCVATHCAGYKVFLCQENRSNREVRLDNSDLFYLVQFPSPHSLSLPFPYTSTQTPFTLRNVLTVPPGVVFVKHIITASTCNHNPNSQHQR